MKSLRTHERLGITLKWSPFSRAVLVNVVSIRFRRRSIGKSASSGLSTPASSFDISSRAPNSSFIELMAASIRAGAGFVRLRPLRFEVA